MSSQEVFVAGHRRTPLAPTAGLTVGGEWEGTGIPTTDETSIRQRTCESSAQPHRGAQVIVLQSDDSAAAEAGYQTVAVTTDLDSVTDTNFESTTLDPTDEDPHWYVDLVPHLAEVTSG